MNQYKRLASNTIIFAIGTFGSKILLLFLTKLYTANISPADLSTKELLEQTANFIIPVITFSITEAIIRYGLDKNYDKGKIFTSSYCVLFFGVCLLAATAPLLHFLPYVDGFLWLLLAYIVMSSIRSIHSQFVRALGYVKLFALDGILATLTLFIFNLIFVSMLQMGVNGFMISVILSDFSSAVFLCFTGRLWKYFGKRYISKSTMKLMVRFAAPLIPTTLLWLVTGFSDRLFLRYMDGPEGLVGETATGIYSIASKLPNLLATFSTIFYQAWNMSAILEHDAENRDHFYKQVYSAYVSLLFVSCGFMIVFVRPLSDLLIDTQTYPEYGEAFRYTPVLVIAVLMMCLNQFFSSVYAASQHTSHSLWTSLAAAVVNVILNIVCIRIWGIMGAVFATFVSYFVGYALRVWDARRYVPFEVSHVQFYINLAVMFGLSWIVVETPPGWMIYLGIGLVFTVVFNFQAIISTIKHVLKR